MKRYFRVAPWSTSLRGVSIFGTLMLIGVAYAAFLAVPATPGFTHNFGLAVALIPVIVVLATVLFVVGGYTVERSELTVHRLIFATRLPLLGLSRIWAEPNLCKGSTRIAGNGGLFSFSGWFYHKRLGKYRLFVTDFRKSVVLQLKDKTIVVSPDEPQTFISYLKELIPSVQVEE